MLKGSPDDCRTAFRTLLGYRKMRVFPDEERRFRVDGMLELDLETADPGWWATGVGVPR